MCSIALGLTLAATAIGAVGQVQQGQAAMASAKYNNQVAQMNAKIAERKAQDALERGKREEQKQRMETAALMGRQKAALGANNVDVTFGSPFELINTTATLGEMDARTIRTNAARESYDFRVEAANKRAQGQMALLEGKSQRTGSLIAAAGTLLGGAGNAYGKFASGSYA